MRTMERFAAWAAANGITYRPLLHLEREHKEQYAKVSREAWDELKAEHLRAPKYAYKEKSSEDVLRANAVTIVALDGTYARAATKGRSIVHNEQLVSVEEFATQQLKDQRYSVLSTESIPFHVLFGALMHPVVCDGQDPFVGPRQFGSRDPAEQGVASMVTAFIASDFGSTGYGARRADAIEAHLARIGHSRETLVEAFEDGYTEGWALRQYLWAHRIESGETATAILEVLPPDRVVACMRYLAMDYWGRYLGWPDMLAHRSDEYFFGEIKGSGDKLSDDQKTWIEGNTRELQLPFKLIKVHRRHVVDFDVR